MRLPTTLTVALFLFRGNLFLRCESDVLLCPPNVTVLRLQLPLRVQSTRVIRKERFNICNRLLVGIVAATPLGACLQILLAETNHGSALVLMSAQPFVGLIPGTCSHPLRSLESR